MTKLYNIKNLTRHNLREWMNKKVKTKTQVQAFRADQIFYWLYQRRVGSFAEMHNLSKGIRKLLEENFWISSLKKIRKTTFAGRLYQVPFVAGRRKKYRICFHAAHQS